MFAKRLLLLDVETTGLNPRRDSLVEIGAIVLSRDALREEAHFFSRVRPTSPITPEAHAIHGLSEADLIDAPDLDTVLTQFDAFAPADVILCGHNVAFDTAFLRVAYERTGSTYRFDYHQLDVWTIAFFSLGARGIKAPAYDLNALCGLFGIPRDPVHDALRDARASASVLRYLYAAVRGAEIAMLGQLDLGAL